jgi:hypothetical protein
LISAEEWRLIRDCSASNDARPSSSVATISPSRTQFTECTISWSVPSSGYVAVWSRPDRETSRVDSVSV